MIHGVNSNTYLSQAGYSKPAGKETQNIDQGKTDERGVILDIGKQEIKNEVYQKPSGRINTEELNRIREDSRRATEALRELVRKLIEKQGKTVEIDAETRTEAGKMIADHGQWGVDAVSSRIVDFAKALAGGDQNKFEELKNAIKQGFEQARQALGGALPDICQKTYDETMRKLEEWANTGDPESE